MPQKKDFNRDPDNPPASPYGPQRRTDDAAGGADSSPFETEPSGQKADAAERPAERGRTQTGDPDRPDANR